MLQSEHFEFGHNSMITKGRQEIKLLWLPAILCFSLRTGNSDLEAVGAPALMFPPHKEKRSNAQSQAHGHPQGNPNSLQSLSPTTSLCEQGWQELGLLPAPLSPPDQNKAQYLERTQIILANCMKKEMNTCLLFKRTEIFPATCSSSMNWFAYIRIYPVV